MFYGELFKKDDEEDIWEELRQMLLNPPSEQEIALKKLKEQAKIDFDLEKMFPEPEKPKKECSFEQKDSLNPTVNESNKTFLEGFGQNSMNGLAEKEFPDLGVNSHLNLQSPSLLKNKNTGLNNNSNLQKPMTGTIKKSEPYLSYEDILPDETDEERELRETQELEAFNKAWDKANGVEEPQKNVLFNYTDSSSINYDESLENNFKFETLLNKNPIEKIANFRQKNDKNNKKQNTEQLDFNENKNGLLTGAATGVDNMTLDAHLQAYGGKNLPLRHNHPEQEYYKISLNLDKIKESNTIPKWFSSNNELLTVKDIKNQTLNQAIKKVIARAQSADINNIDNENLNNTDVVVARRNSPIVKMIKESPDLISYINKHLLELKSGKVISGSFPFKYEENVDSPNIYKNKYSLSRAIHNTDVCNMKMEADGSISMFLVDYYDFAFGGGRLVNNAYKQQQNNMLRNYALVVPVRIKI